MNSPFNPPQMAQFAQPPPPGNFNQRPQSMSPQQGFQNVPLATPKTNQVQNDQMKPIPSTNVSPGQPQFMSPNPPLPDLSAKNILPPRMHSENGHNPLLNQSNLQGEKHLNEPNRPYSGAPFPQQNKQAMYQPQPPALGHQPTLGASPNLGPSPMQGNILSGQPSHTGPPPLAGQSQQGQPQNITGPHGPAQSPQEGHVPMLRQQIPNGQFPPTNYPPHFAGQEPPMPRPPHHLGQHPPMPGSQPPLNQGQVYPQQNNTTSHMPNVRGQLPINQAGQFQRFPTGQQNQPPLADQMGPQGQINQYPGNPNQLSNQMQNMNVSGPRQYPSALQKDPMSNSPHMPPPVNQQGFINGQQVQSPQGYPPGPGPQPGPGTYPQQGPGAYPQQGPTAFPQPAYPQNKRLDPDHMPNPIQVTRDDQENRSGVFVTNQKGLVPPLVTTDFVVQDQGNSSPRFMRSTMYNVPITQDIMKQTAVPFCLVISPMARIADEEYEPPIINFGELGPVRCVRCKAYMCPYMQFIDSGRRFQCVFCKATSDVPQEYFQHLDHTGNRMDKYERPELVLGTYEFVATKDYCRNNVMPKAPAFIFVIDVSYNSIKSGLVSLLCSQMKTIIENLPIDQGQTKSNMKVGFITYNSSVHFYNIKGTLAAPQMMVVGDTQEMFMPLLDGFLCTPEESGSIIDALMEQIPEMFGNTRETETILLPAILAGVEALKASECAGKLMVFHSTLPTAEAPGKLKNRDDRKVLGTEKEKTVLVPQNQAYNQLGQDCVGAGCCVDLFLFNNAYIDIATLSQVSRLSGGEVFKYTYFQADIDGERLIRDVVQDISRPIAFDAIMRVRTSTGVRPTDFYGHFFMSNTTDMELAAVDCDKAVAVEIKHDDKLNEEDGVYIQSALLYTSCSGQRRLRLLNLSLKTCSQMSDLYRSCDLDTIVNYISKQSVYKLLENSSKVLKDSIITRGAQMLAMYRKNCAGPTSAGQLILPECMKLLPLYVNCLLKSDALSGGSDITCDDRSFFMQAVMTMDVPTSLNYFYPRLLPLHTLDQEKENVQMPNQIRCTIEKMTEQGVYILENGIHMFLWIGLAASPDFVQKVFGVPSAIQIDIEKCVLPELDNPLSVSVRSIIEKIRIQRHRYMRLTIVRQREKLEPVFKHFLVEDGGSDGSASYVDFLCHMHKEIRSILS